ncbi:hypothetical protein GCM10011571_29080 [Marinithermofilum abyssi]|uniref:NodB homology domain-containing protein n=1 Tax=Marinithermofilum abyssi TaxID=1571185 RepID=A0A8J2YDC7_9BACL|nr:polysaccharide deacetylase family protein [Marinithermofilum abyssi]GGE25098.1 hypothetical protein GCM10011571_29080 [Marinithermofilum abyssi]
MKRKRLRMGLFLYAVVPLLAAASHFPSVTAYIHTVRAGEAVPVLSRDALWEKIEEGAAARSELPVKARIDRVWRAVPGYDGVTVDKETTYRIAKRKPNDPTIHWVYKEVPLPDRDGLDALFRKTGPQPIYRGNEQKPMAALMINVAWGTEHLPEMLDILAREKVSATFFLDGSWLKKHPEMARELVRRGHEIGNHAYSHPLMSGLSTGAIHREIAKTEALIEQTTGLNSRFFAPPAGDFNDAVVKEADKFGMKTVLWTVDTVDWKKTSTPKWMVNRVKKGVGKGSLVLMHPTDRTAAALPKIIRTVKHKGIKLGTVSEVLSSKRVEHVEPVIAF